MTAVQRRFKNVISRLGDSFTVGASSRVGVFAVLSPSGARSYLSDADLSLLGRPLRLVYVPYDDSTAVSDVVAWDGLSLTVKQIVKARHAGETIAKLMVLA